MIETKKLIEELKKEIEDKIKEVRKYYRVKEGSEGIIDETIPRLKSQLQFAEKLIEAIKKDITKNKPCPNEHPILAGCYEQVIEEINKILNSALEK